MTGTAGPEATHRDRYLIPAHKSPDIVTRLFAAGIFGETSHHVAALMPMDSANHPPSTSPDLRRPLRIGTRRSRLALWQANWVRDQLRAQWGQSLVVELVEIVTDGDRIQDRPLHQIGGKGLFVNGIEERLSSGDVDLAVHSMKDLPGQLADGLKIVCTPKRADPRDALIVREGVCTSKPTVETLPAGARVGTTSLRRTALVRRLAPGVDVQSLRGNVPTRLKKLDDGQFDAILLAAAGLHRLELQHRISAYLDPAVFCPAATQGILALEARGDDTWVHGLVAPLGHGPTSRVAAAERAFLARLEGGCQVPMGCFAEPDGEGGLTLRGIVADPSGAPYYSATTAGRNDPTDLGTQLAEQLLAQGAGGVLESLKLGAPA